MQNYSVYEDMASRTGGDIYIGVVGPVRTGKSTFIKRFMEKLVLPFAEPTARKRMTDELPQPAAGKTVMTTEPKFIPAKAATIKIRDGVNASVRLVDCVGYAVAGASGFEEDGKPRLVKTPWQEEALPFEEAASLGTEKVIKEHSTIGVLVTTDGSITEIPRESYAEAEERTAMELRAIGKPFVILLNCKDPANAEELRVSLEEKYETPVVAANAEKMDKNAILFLLQKALFEFPLTQLDIRLPVWVQTLPQTDKIVSALMEKLKKTVPTLTRMRDCLSFETTFEEDGYFQATDGVSMDLGTGKATLTLTAKDGLFYRVLGEKCGEEIADDYSLMRYMVALSEAKRGYDKIKDAFRAAEEDGYGSVTPLISEMVLEEPKLVKKGSGYGVHFKASAPSYHIFRVDVGGEVSPIVGSQAQGEEFAKETREKFDLGDGSVLDTNIFGKTLKDLLSEDLSKKTETVPHELKKKMRRTLTRIVNEGRGGVICILL